MAMDEWLVGADSNRTSPQSQPTTDRKENNLDRIEHPLHNRYTCFTGRDHR